MITEDYVNYETAKLLKEKGFYSPYCYSYYFPDIESKTPCIIDRVIDVNEDKYLAPTLQMAMKWLREVHRIEINIVLTELNYDNTRKYQFDVFSGNVNDDFGSVQRYGFNTYEQACESAIKYCLQNLI